MLFLRLFGSRNVFCLQIVKGCEGVKTITTIIYKIQFGWEMDKVCQILNYKCMFVKYTLTVIKVASIVSVSFNLNLSLIGASNGFFQAPLK
jgi:hypothetical protein